MKKSLFLLIGLIIVFGIGLGVWYNVNIGLNKEFLLLKTYEKYLDLFETNACREAYEFLTRSAQARHNFEEFSEGCEGERVKPFTRDDEIIDVVFVNKNLAKIRIRSTRKIEDRENTFEIFQSWVYEDGSWKREWPD